MDTHINKDILSFHVLNLSLVPLKLPLKGTRDQIANNHWIIEKNKRIPEKHLLL